MIDVIIRHIPKLYWLRIAVQVTLRRGEYEDGTGWMYAGLIWRWGRRIGPVNMTVMVFPRR